MTQDHPNDPIVDKPDDGTLLVTLTVPITAAKARRAAYLMDNLATAIEESGAGAATTEEAAPQEEDPVLAAAAVLDDVRAVLLGRGRDHGYENKVVNLISLPGGTMGVSVSRHEEGQAIVAIAFGATGARADMRDRLALEPGGQVPPLSYVEITDFDRAGVGHLLGAVKLAFPDMLMVAEEEVDPEE